MPLTIVIHLAKRRSLKSCIRAGDLQWSYDFKCQGLTQQLRCTVRCLRLHLLTFKAFVSNVAVTVLITYFTECLQFLDDDLMCDLTVT